jgi:hypothetical protein
MRQICSEVNRRYPFMNEYTTMQHHHPTLHKPVKIEKQTKCCRSWPNLIKTPCVTPGYSNGLTLKKV